MTIKRVGVEACNLGTHRTGLGNYVFEILDRLCADHPEVTFYLYSNAPVVPPARANVVVRESPGRRGPLWQNLDLRRMLRADDVDLLWATNGLCPLFGLGRTRIVLTIHDLVYRLAGSTARREVRWARGLFQGLSARRADAVVPVSQATADDVLLHYGVRPAAVINPVLDARFVRQDPDRIAEVLARHAIAQPYLLSVGTLEPRKNFVSLLDAYVGLRAGGAQLPQLVLVGGNGWLNAEIEARVSEAERTGWIRRLGYLPFEDLPALYSGCTAFILPSVYEGFGMPIAEAQLCGAPVLHGEHGSMVEAGGGLGVAFAPTREGIAAALSALAAGESPLCCRLPADAAARGARAADDMWRLFESVVV